ncbi:hypothetical protein GRF29_28g1775185 [Pseudopithomyces chartarum]|uniref:Uncharacterized protein n=1 Tax=Pseudopithomyces chartarum TaxID=1892770 RepID=A0AAN6M3I8_9PLEO|nr:hypothetical protein GRF29_28g1775185 [Pseudopithomyces chartarum]
MSHSRSPSLNTRVSRFRDGYDYDESLATTSFLRPRDSSPSSQKRVSIFKEHTTPAMGTALFNADNSRSDIDLSRPETHYDPHSQRDNPPQSMSSTPADAPALEMRMRRFTATKSVSCTRLAPTPTPTWTLTVRSAARRVQRLGHRRSLVHTGDSISRGGC